MTTNSPGPVSYTHLDVYKRQVLMELKVAGGLPLWMAHVLSCQGIFKTSFSKYGAAYQNILLAGRRGDRKYA